MAAAALAFGAATLDPERYQPTLDDVERGNAFVGLLRGKPGPVLSPFAAWIPAQAGSNPSLLALLPSISTSPVIPAQAGILSVALGRRSRPAPG